MKAHAHIRAPAPRPVATVRRRRVLGIPMAMTDYDGAMDVMDSMVERPRARLGLRRRRCTRVMVAQDDPEMQHGAHRRP